MDVDKVSMQLAEIKYSLSLDCKVPALRTELLVDFHGETNDNAPVDYQLYLNEGADSCLYTVTKHWDKFENTSKVALKAKDMVICFTMLRIGQQIQDVNLKIAVFSNSNKLTPQLQV